MSTLRRSQLAIVASAIALVLVFIAWNVSSSRSSAPPAESASQRVERSTKLRARTATSAVHASDAPTEIGAKRMPTEEHAVLDERPEHIDKVVDSAAVVISKIGRTLRGRVFFDASIEREIRVALFVFDGRVPSSAALDSKVADKDGKFELHVDRVGEFVLLAFRDDSRPTTKRISITAQSTPKIELEPFTLGRGEAICGELRSADSSECFGVRVRAREPGEADAQPVYQVLDSRFAWRNGAFEWAERESFTDEDSTFTLRNLAPADYSLSVFGIGSPEFDVLDLMRISAPQWDWNPIVLQVSCCRVRVHFSHNRVPAAGVAFMAQCDGGRGGYGFKSLTADQEGNASLSLLPESELELRCGNVVRRIAGCIDDRELDVYIDL